MLGDNYLDNDTYSPSGGALGYLGNPQAAGTPMQGGQPTSQPSALTPDQHPVLNYLKGLLNQRQAPQPAQQQSVPSSNGLMFPWQSDAVGKGNGIMSGIGKSALGNL